MGQTTFSVIQPILNSRNHGYISLHGYSCFIVYYSRIEKYPEIINSISLEMLKVNYKTNQNII